jgi:hypothetical protein
MTRKWKVLAGRDSDRARQSQASGPLGGLTVSGSSQDSAVVRLGDLGVDPRGKQRGRIVVGSGSEAGFHQPLSEERSRVLEIRSYLGRRSAGNVGDF